jgi:chemotaxis protein MotB
MKLPVQICLSVLMVMVVAACVPAKDFRAKVNEAESLMDKVGRLEGALEAERSLHQENVDRLESENEMLKNKNDTLTAANTEIASRIESSRIDLVKEITDIKKALVAEEINGKMQADRINELEAELEEKTAGLEMTQSELDTLREERRRAVEARKKDVSDLKSTYDELVSELNEEIQKGRIAVSQLKDKLTLSMVDKILFDSGKAQVNTEGRAVLERVAEMLNKVEDKQIRIEGHTDNVPIGSRLQEKFPSNWELSTARATNVVRYLQDEGGMDPGRLSAAGYSEFKPVASNDTPEGRTSNRRIEIVLVPLEAPAGETEEEEIPLNNGQDQ